MRAQLSFILLSIVCLLMFEVAAFAGTPRGCCDSSKERTTYTDIREDGYRCKVRSCSTQCTRRGAGECDARWISNKITSECPTECPGGRELCVKGTSGGVKYCCPEGSSCDGEGGCKVDDQE